MNLTRQYTAWTNDSIATVVAYQVPLQAYDHKIYYSMASHALPLVFINGVFCSRLFAVLVCWSMHVCHALSYVLAWNEVLYDRVAVA
jgi:hypothetical protein